MKQIISGTREWAAHNVNCCSGCSHGCLYCYARTMAVRFGKIRPEDWTDERLRSAALDKRYGKMDGTVMFPTTHDITPTNVEGCLFVLDKLLVAGNRVLIVSKPHPEIIVHICRRYVLRREQILFRFTIGADSNTVLSFWEPGAPSLEERLDALRAARAGGFDTSVSMEPLLTPERVAVLVALVEPWVSHSIWIGKANLLRYRSAWARKHVDCDLLEAEIKRIEAGQTDEKVREIYELLKDNPKIRWKKSYKKVIGLEMPAEAGLDV